MAEKTSAELSLTVRETKAGGAYQASSFGQLLRSAAQTHQRPRTNALSNFRLWIHSRDGIPCFHDGWSLPAGWPPPAPWNRQTDHPLTAGPLHRSPVRFERAVHLGAALAALMGFSSRFVIYPTPLQRPVLTEPTMACPPSATVTCWTTTVCLPPLRCFRRASTWAAKVRASLLKPV